MDGKSDRLDAEQIARAVLGLTSTAIPKSKSGMVEVIRTLRVTRASAVKARTQAFNTLFGRDDRRTVAAARRAGRADQADPGQPLPAAPPRDRRPPGAGRRARADAHRRRQDRPARPRPPLEDTRRRDQDPQQQIEALVTAAAPELVELHGVGVEIAGQFLVTAGDNPERIRNEAAFAKLCGVAPQPASSGRTTGRHRLSRSGDRAANSALYIVTIVRMRHHQPTRDYVERRTAEGLSKREIIRCLIGGVSRCGPVRAGSCSRYVSGGRPRCLAARRPV